jgi:hypothetical protein
MRATGEEARESIKKPAVLIVGFGVALLSATLSVYFYGPSTSAPILALIASLLGYFVTSVATAINKEPPGPVGPTGPDPKTKVPKSKFKRFLTFFTIFLVGVIVGILFLKILMGMSSSNPWVRIDAPREVGEFDRVRLIWREIPKGDEVWILVFDSSSGCYGSGHCYYPQKHFELGLSRGDEMVDVLVGRKDQRGREFQLIPVLVKPDAQKALRDGAFAGMPDIPAGVVMFLPSVVNRRTD